MAGTSNITQTRPSYVCQSITSTGPGESALNALETINVASIAQDAIATIAPSGDFYEWTPTSLVAPGVGVVIPLGQNPLVAGRWIKLTSLPVGVVYNQSITGLPLAMTTIPEYGPSVSAVQQPVLNFVNGNVSDGAGQTNLTLEYQQVFYSPIAGPFVPMQQRARLQILGGAATVANEPVTVVDDPATDSTVVTVHQMSVPASSNQGVSVLAMGGLPNVCTAGAAAANGAAFAKAKALAIANGSRKVYIPAGYWTLPEVSTVYLTSATSFVASAQSGLTLVIACSAVVATWFANGSRVRVSSAGTPADYCEGILTSIGTTASILVDTVAGSGAAHTDWHMAAHGITTGAIIGADSFTWEGASPQLTTLMPYIGSPGLVYESIFTLQSVAGDSGVGCNSVVYKSMALSSGCNGEYTNYGIYSPVVYNVRTEDILTTGFIQKVGQYLSYGDVVRVIRPQATSLTGIPVAVGLAGNTTDVEITDCRIYGNNSVGVFLALCTTARVTGTISQCPQGGIIVSGSTDVDLEDLHCEGLGGTYALGIGLHPGISINGIQHLSFIYSGLAIVSTAGPASLWTYQSAAGNAYDRNQDLRVGRVGAYGTVPCYSVSFSDPASSGMWLTGTPAAAYPTLRIKIIAGGPVGTATFQYALDGVTYSGTLTSAVGGNALGASGLTVRWDTVNSYTNIQIGTFNLTGLLTSMVAGTNWDGLVVDGIWQDPQVPTGNNPMSVLATIQGAHGTIGTTRVGYYPYQMPTMQEAIEGGVIAITDADSRISYPGKAASLLQTWSTPPTVAVGTAPFSIAFDGAYLWVCNSTDSTVTKVRASTGVVAGTYPSGGAGCQGLCYDWVNGCIWVVNSGVSSVTKLSAATGNIIGTYTTGANPQGVCFDGTNIWTANYGTNTVTQLTAATGAFVRTVTVGNNPRAVCFDGSFVWASNYTDGTVSKINASTGAVPNTLTVGVNPWAVVFDGTYVWVANFSGNSLSRINAATNAITGPYAVGVGTIGLAFDGRDIWCTAYSDATVQRVSTAGVVLTTTRVGTGPRGLCFDGYDVWVANSGGTTITRV